MKLIHQFCERCGKPFEAAEVSVECPVCQYATKPHRIVLGYARHTPLIKKLVTT